jgi:hypothetical protein
MPHRLGWRRSPFAHAFLVICMVYGIWQLSPLFWSELGNDARVFYSAARVAEQGGNPYDYAQLTAEFARVNAEGRAAGLGRSSIGPNEYHYPPLMTWFWRRLAPLGDWGFFWANSAALLLAGVLGFELVMHTLGWRRRWLARGFFVFSLPMLTVLSSGNPATVLLLATGGALLAATRGRPWLAGALLAACLIKPPVGIPVAAAIMLGRPGQRQALLGGMAIGTAAFALLNLAAGGFAATRGWVLSLVQFSATIDVHQVAVVQQRFLAGLSAPFLFLGPVPATVIALALAAVALVWAYRRGHGWPDRTLGLALLLAAALAVGPYLHTYDLVLEALPVLVLASLPRDPINRAVLGLWATAPVLNLAVVLAVAAVTGSPETPWSFAVALNAATLLALALACRGGAVASAQAAG